MTSSCEEDTHACGAKATRPPNVQKLEPTLAMAIDGKLATAVKQSGRQRMQRAPRSFKF